MVKFLHKVVFVCAIVCTLVSNVNAQSLSVIDGTKRVENRFFVVSGTTTFEVNPVVFKAVSKNKKAYALVTVPGDASATTVVERVKATSEIVNVDSISLADNNEDARLFLSNGTVYENSNPDWLTVLPGQHVEIINIDGLTKVINRYHTVDRDVALSNPMPILFAENVSDYLEAYSADVESEDERNDIAMADFSVPVNQMEKVREATMMVANPTTATTVSSATTTYRFGGLK